MNDHKKTKLELLRELKDLHEKYDSLKASYTRIMADLKLVEEKLLFINSAVDSTSDAIGISDAEGHHFYQNKALTRLFGYDTAAEIEAAGGPSVVVKDPEVAKEMFGNIMDGVSWSGELEMVTKSGHVFPAYERADAIKDEKGNIIGLIGIIDDITERKQAEEALKQSEEKFRNFFENSIVGTAITAFNGEMKANSAFCRIVGYSEEELMQLKWQEITHPDDINSEAEIISSLVCGEKETARWEKRYIHKSGNIIWADISTVLQRDENNNPEYFITSVQEITEQKQASEVLQKSEQRYRSLLTNLEAGIVVHAPDTSVITCNQRASELLGSSETLLKGKKGNDPCWKFVHENGVPLKSDKYPVNRIVTSKKSFKDLVLGIQNPVSNNITWCKVNGFPVFDGAGGLIEVLISFIDITQRKHAEEELVESERLLRESQAIAHLGSFVWDLSTGFWKSSEILNEIFGIDKYYDRSLEGWVNIVHPGWREIMSGYVSKEILIEHQKFDKQYQIIRQNDGQERWVHGLAVLEFDSNIEPVRLIGTISDITERRNYEEALRKSEAIYRNLVEVIPDGVYKSTEEGKFVEVNPAMVNMLGYSSREDLMAIDIKSQLYFQIEDRESAELNENNAEIGIFRMKKKDGSEIWVEDHGWLTHDKNTEIIYHEGIMRDVTDRRIAEAQLVKLSSAIEQSPVSVVITDSDGNIEYGNPKLAESSGYDLDELIGKNTRIFSSGEKPKNEIRELWATISSGRIWSGEFHNKNKNGALYWEQATISPIFNEKGGITHYLAVKEDISERKRSTQIQQTIYAISDAALSAIELDELIKIICLELGKLLDTTNFYIAFYDEDSGMLTTKFESDEKDMIDSWPAEKSATGYVIRNQKSLLAYDTDMLALIEAGEINLIGTPSKVWLGVPLWIDDKVIGAVVVQNYNSREAYNEKDKLMLEFISDQISMAIHRKKTEKDLISALQKAEESDRLKSAFLANMSHEIRTPMNGILGFAEMLKQPGLSGDEQQEYIEIILKGGDRMLNIINDIVDISKIESGMVEAAYKQANINELTGFVYSFFKPQADAKGIVLTCKNCLLAHNAAIITDKEKVYAILSNLVKNAFKYTDKGSIEFGYNLVPDKNVSSQPEPNKGYQLEFFVKDTGIGIPFDRQNAIFDRFVQADISDSRAFQGAGLGLSISKAYVEILGGQLWVESEEGKGSTFYFTIPYKPVSNDKPTATGVVQPDKAIHLSKKIKVLLVEDDEISERLMSLAIKAYCSHIIKAVNGVEAIDACRKNPDIDLVIMDIKMPVMDGHEATRQIREFNKEVVIIAQTAFGLAGDREKALQAGCNEYISKPVKLSAFDFLVRKYFANPNLTH